MDELGGDPGAPFAASNLPQLLDTGDRLLKKVAIRYPELDRLLATFPLTPRGIVLGAVALLLLLILPPLIKALLHRTHRLEPNFRGDRIPQSFGLVIVLWASSLLGLTSWLYPGLRWACGQGFIAVLGFGLLGFADDLWGEKRIKGLRGHFAALLQARRVTTGLLKAVGGGLLALWLGFRLFPSHPAQALLSAALIALSANAINLLDLRPGRAGGVFLLCAAPCLYALVRADNPEAALLLLLVLLPTLPVWRRDAQAEVMLGDAGSNPLGASLGLAIASHPSLALRLIALSVLVGLHLLTERLSLTRLIEEKPLLRRLDQLLGVRDTSLG